MERIVNGIRNPFSYEPWRGKRTFEAMFEILQADIAVLQETKIQRKDLRDDMVLVPGWDCYFSLPKIKKGYSGVVIYTRNATCAPIRAEEGITGVLCPPNSSVSFRDLPEEQQIGGYPTFDQLSQFELDAATLDSEGRCVILEFPAFVLIGVYCPANRDESRDCFRVNFFDALDSRVRNLVAMGKKVFVTGDINISRAEIDSAHVADAIRKATTTEDEFVSAPVRRLFNQMLAGGKVLGERDEGRERPVLHDICRSFHPDRKGMYTCWEQKLNARPGNFGSRIDYVLCSLDMQDWFNESNIQEGLLGSDHCPVYAVFKDEVTIDGENTKILDIMNPSGVFKNGERQQEYLTKCLLPTSGRLIPEFDKRRSIKDMFSRKPASSQKPAPSVPALGRSSSAQQKETPSTVPERSLSGTVASPPAPPPGENTATKGVTRKRPEKNESSPYIPVKRSKSVAGQAPANSAPGQKTLRGFFKPKITASDPSRPDPLETPEPISSQTSDQVAGSPSKPVGSSDPSLTDGTRDEAGAHTAEQSSPSATATPAAPQEDEFVHDPIVSKEDWSKLFTKKPPPPCDGHQEACIKMTTKKPGVNCGRSFWICPRPLGPSGNKEKGTEWRCPTFKWTSDWNPSTQ
ncbi:hypothetical protein AWENTII_012335 [Aspergillus wentii]